MIAFTLRDPAEADKPFLYAVYASTREEEMNAWGWEEQEQAAFLRMQYDFQCRSYSMQYPSLEDQVIVCEGARVGRIATAQSEEGMTIVDIAIMPAYRGRGIGTSVLEKVCQDAMDRGVPVWLSVRHDNRAVRLYRRLGFACAGRDEMNLYMKKSAV